MVDRHLRARFRKKIVDMVCSGKDGHIPSAFSILEIVTALYQNILRVDPMSPNDEDRDVFILSKGHGCLALYVNLHNRGFITEEDLSQFCQFGGILGEHPDCNKIPGVEANTGSLGHGIAFAIGRALGSKIQRKANRVFVVVGDGECQEGSVWEAANIASNQKLGNVCVLIDRNGSSTQLMPIEDLVARWRAFGWEAIELDGHDIDEIVKQTNKIDFSNDIPTALICNTIKGYGAECLTGHGMWHHRIPNDVEYKQIMTDIESWEHELT